MFNFFKKDEKKMPITIELEDLSALWVGYNRIFEAVTSPSQVDESAAQKIPDAITPVPLSDLNENENKTTPEMSPAPSIPTYTTFLQDVVQPYRNYCTAQNAINPIMALLELLETEGSCPSIAKITSSNLSDSDNDYITIWDALSHVTLRDHSHRVAAIAVKLLKEGHKDYENLVPRMLVCTLAHDIGKIPSLRADNGQYVKADHPIIGGRKLREILSSFPEPDRVSWIDAAVKVVESHHQQSKDFFLSVLQAADAQARRTEIELYRKDFVFLEWSEWFSPQQLLEAIKPEINVIAPHTKNQWQAFSFKGVVYAKPDILINKTIELAKAKKVFDMRLLRSQRDQEAALRPIMNSLKNIQAIYGDDPGTDYYGEEYEISHGSYKYKNFLIPLKVNLFGLASEIEKDKSGFFYNLQTVKSMGKPRKPNR
jgi:hypothetical protein